MSPLTNPLFGAVAFLTGLLIGVLVGRWSRNREWVKREQLMVDSFRLAQNNTGCWVKAQIDANEELG